MVMVIFVENCLILSCILGYHMLLFNRYIFAIFMPFCAFLVKVHKKKDETRTNISQEVDA